jgi:hypothetical protein
MALGFRVRPAAAGQMYQIAMIDLTIRHAVHDPARRIGDGGPSPASTASHFADCAAAALGRDRHQGRHLPRRPMCGGSECCR